jgi:hypothetical protein
MSSGCDFVRGVNISINIAFLNSGFSLLREIGIFDRFFRLIITNSFTN